MGYAESMLLRDETIIYTGRKHFTLMLGHIVTEIILLGLTGVAWWLVEKVLVQYKLTEHSLAYVLYGVLALAGVILVGSAVIDYLRWYNDCVVLTNRRIMKFEGLFNKHMIESSLNKINDVALNQTFMGRIIGYGDIMILTAADTGIQEMRNIANPIEFKRALAEARVYDEVQAQKAVTQAAVDAVEDAVEEVVNDQQDAQEHVVFAEDDQVRHDDRAPTPPANVRPNDDVLHAMLTRPRRDDDVASGDDDDYDADLQDRTVAHTHDADRRHEADSAHDDADAVVPPADDRQPHEPTTTAHEETTTLLAKLESLYDAGVLTRDEYETKRRQIIGEE